MLRETIGDTVSENMTTSLVSVEDAISSCADFADSIEKSGNAAECLSITYDTSSKPAYQFRYLSKFLNSFPDEAADLVYCHFPKHDYVVADSYTETTKRFFENYYSGENFTYEQWLEKLGSFSYSNFVLTKNANNEECIDFFFSSPLMDISTKPNFTCVMRIKIQTLISRIREYLSFDNCNIYIIDKNNNIILQDIAVDEISTPVYNNVQYTNRKSTGETLEISKTMSINSWQMVVTIPLKVIDSRLSYIQIILAVILVLCLVFSVLLTGYFTRKNYTPLRKLLNLAGGDVASFKMINEALNRLQNKLARFNQLSSNNESIKRDAFLARLLTGQTNQLVSVEESLKKYSISFRSEYFAVIIFRIINADMLFADDSDKDFDNYKRAETISFIMRNVIEEIISVKHNAYLFDFNGLHTAIVNINEVENWQSDLKSALEDAKVFIQDNFSFSFIAAMSDLCTGVARLSRGFDEATKAFSYRTTIKNNDIMLYSDFHSENKGAFFAEMNELISFIKAGNQKVAEKLADSMFAEIGRTGEAAELLSIKIMTSAITALTREESSIDADSYKELFTFIEHTHTENPFAQLTEFIGAACSICTASQNNTEDNSPKTNIISEIKEYVGANYKNPDLNVAAVGYYFDITPYYISSLFKKSEGISILDYISLTRINAAVELLKTDMSVVGIAETVGFGNVRTFVRVFKNQKGCSPKQYREGIQK